MLATSASRPAMFSDTMRRVRLEKESVNRNCPARLSQLSGRRQPVTGCVSASAASMTTEVDTPGSFRPESGCVRSSTADCFSSSSPAILPPSDDGVAKARQANFRSGFLETIADPVERFDHLEFLIDHLELLAQPL